MVMTTDMIDGDVSGHARQRMSLSSSATAAVAFVCIFEGALCGLHDPHIFLHVAGISGLICLPGPTTAITDTMTGLSR